MRTYPRTSFERCIQIARWVNHEFDIWEPGAVRIELVPELEGGSAIGITFERRGKLIVQLAKKGNPTRSMMIDTLLHELAHVALWDTGRGLLHGKEYWITFGRIWDAYHDRGFSDSKSYSCET